MSPGASVFHPPPRERGDDHGHGAFWATAIPILFALVAVISFAVDQSVTLSSLPAPPASTGR